MEEIAVLGLALLGMGVAVVGGMIGYTTIYKPRRRRQIERDHARSKTNPRR